MRKSMEPNVSAWRILTERARMVTGCGNCCRDSRRWALQKMGTPAPALCAFRCAADRVEAETT